MLTTTPSRVRPGCQRPAPSATPRGHSTCCARLISIRHGNAPSISLLPGTCHSRRDRRQTTFKRRKTRHSKGRPLAPSCRAFRSTSWYVSTPRRRASSSWPIVARPVGERLSMGVLRGSFRPTAYSEECRYLPGNTMSPSSTGRGPSGLALRCPLGRWRALLWVDSSPSCAAHRDRPGECI